MNVLVDTSVWSLALRRNPIHLNPSERISTGALAQLVNEGRAQVLGIVRQELLSGVRDEKQFMKLRDYMRAFDDPSLQTEDYESGAFAHNRCRSRGIAGSISDFLICGIALRRDWQVFTTDRDFARFETVLGIKLFRAA